MSHQVALARVSSEVPSAAKSRAKAQPLHDRSSKGHRSYSCRGVLLRAVSAVMPTVHVLDEFAAIAEALGDTFLDDSTELTPP
jgi:hypothetical protein